MIKLSILFVVFFYNFVISTKGDVAAGQESKTLCIIKPNSIQAGVAEDIISIIASKYKITKSKKTIFTERDIRFLYQTIKDKPFFQKEVIPAFKNKAIIVLRIEGDNAILGMRDLIGNKNPKIAAEKTIRALYGKDITENAIHCSDSYANYIREVSLFFPNEIRELKDVKVQ
jgi:nucleoside-diphosphate kinase